MEYIITFMMRALFGVFGMGLIAASGKHNACEDGDREDKMKEINM